jgi:hypothetical protein
MTFNNIKSFKEWELTENRSKNNINRLGNNYQDVYTANAITYDDDGNIASVDNKAYLKGSLKAAAIETGIGILMSSITRIFNELINIGFKKNQEKEKLDNIENTKATVNVSSVLKQLDKKEDDLKKDLKEAQQKLQQIRILIDNISDKRERAVAKKLFKKQEDHIKVLQTRLMEFI